jgi:hypothetical protein
MTVAHYSSSKCKGDGEKVKTKIQIKIGHIFQQLGFRVIRKIKSGV